MSQSEQVLMQFTDRVQQLILLFNNTKRENETLRDTIAELQNKVQQLESKLVQAQNDYNSLKTAKMIQIADADIEASQKRLSKLIRDVNKCITLLNEK